MWGGGYVCVCVCVCVCVFYLMTNLTHNSFLCMFISILYVFWAFRCSSSGDSVASIRYLVYVTLCRWPSGMQVWTEQNSVQTCITDGHLHRVTYTRYHIDTIESPDDDRSKHVENWNKHTQKIIVFQVGH